MNLRSGRVILASRADEASKISTQGSGTRSVRGHLESFCEREHSDTDTETTQSLETEMENEQEWSRDMHSNMERKGKAPRNPFNEMPGELTFEIALTFCFTNAYGAEIYKDPLGRYAYKSAEHRTPFNDMPMVNYQGDLYMGKDGARYEVTKYPESVDALGILKTDIVYENAEQTVDSHPKDRGYNHADEPGTHSSHLKQHIDRLLEQWSAEKEIKVTKVFQDNPLQEVFRDSRDVYYATTKLPHLQFVVTHTLILEKQEGYGSRIIDGYGNHYRTLDWSEVRGLTWKGVSLFSEPRPTATARPGETAFSEETRIPTSAMLQNQVAPSFSNWNTERVPTPMPPWREVGERVMRIPERVEPRPMYREPNAWQRDLLPEIRQPRRHVEEGPRRTRPSSLQKMVKKYDGSGDPHDHVAAYRQAVHAEQVRDVHTQVEGFGLTLESKALTWFQALEPQCKVSMAALEKDFISSFSKMGVKHMPESKLQAFKQKEHENVRDCVNRLKQYIARCPIEEKPSQIKLVSIFLEGLKDKTLYKHLYAKKHQSFVECCIDAMDFDDNFDDSDDTTSNSTRSEVRPNRRPTNPEIKSSVEMNPDQIVETVLRRLGQTYRPPMKQIPTSGPYMCGRCGHPHRTEDCPSYTPGVNPHVQKKWCQVCKWNPTHATQECLHIARLARDREASLATYAQPRQNYQQPTEQARPVLGAQPPAPGTIPVRYVDTELQDTGHELVVSNPYYVEPEPEWIPTTHEPSRMDDQNEGAYQDTNAMMLVGPVPRMQMQYTRNQVPLGVKCFKCQGNHYARDCPNDPQQLQKPRLPPIERYCEGCCVEHFPKDCPIRRDELAKQNPRTSLNCIDVIPSPSNSSGEEERQSLKVVTRAQSLKINENVVKQESEGDRKSTRRKQKRRGSKEGKKQRRESDGSNEGKRKAKGNSNATIQPVENKETVLGSAESSEGGSVIIDKVHEHLKAALDAYNSRITPLTEIPKKLQEYPNPREEKVNLALNQQLIRDTQTMLEGPPPAIRREKASSKPNLETIHEVASSKEKEESRQSFALPQSNQEELHEDAIGESIPEADESMVRDIWGQVRKQAEDHWSDSNASPPFSVMDLDHPEWQQSHEHLENLSRKSQYVPDTNSYEPRPYMDRAATYYIPSVRRAVRNKTSETKLQELLETPVPWTLTLGELLRLKPELLEELVQSLTTQGEVNKKTQSEQSKTRERVEVNKVSELKIKDTGNTTLPVECEGIKTIAILDSGAGISIATKSIWEKWGKPTMRSTRMNLQLADGTLENPMGLLENITVKSCGIEYEQTFAVVDFGKNPNYEVILGRPFMRQFRMIQDWGYDYLYLRHETAITRVNLKNHSHRDVTYTPIEEFDSASSENSDSVEDKDQMNLWVCGASRKSVMTDGSAWCRDIMDDAYIPAPFPEEQLEPVEWSHVLATMDVCCLNHGIKFCDEDGNDIIPIRMVQVVSQHESEVQPVVKEKFHQDEISIEDLSSGTDAIADDEFVERNSQTDSDDDSEVPESELEKVRMLLRSRQEIPIEIPKGQKRRKFCQSHRQLRKQMLKQKREKENQERIDKEQEDFKPLEFKGKNEYLYYVKARDGIKEEVQWKYGMLLTHKVMAEKDKNPKKKKEDNKTKRTNRKAKSNVSANQMTKVERKALLEEKKRVLKTAWSTASDDSDEETNDMMPENLKKFTIQDRRIILQKPVRQKPDYPGVSYDGPEYSKQVNLANDGDEPKMVNIATDLSSRVDELEKLDETRLLAIAGMYAEKRRRKQWHDQNIKTQRFKKGDLVLMYTLKKHKRKLKKRGIGPFVVNQLSSSGAVRLETLEGAQMPSFINGSRLKRYEKPLTEEMLAQLHKAKTYKEGQKELQEQAQIEAHMRRKQIRERANANIFVVSQVDAITEDSQHVPPFLLAMKFVMQHQILDKNALIDLGADCNVLPYSTWEQLGKPTLETCTVTLQGFLNKTSTCLGKICLKVQIQTESMYVTFFVANKVHRDFAVLLGRTWMCTTNCQINLRTRSYALEVNSVNLTGKSSEEYQTTSDAKQDKVSKSSYQKSSQPNLQVQGNKSPKQYQLQGRGEPRQLFYWRPKTSQKTRSQVAKHPATSKPEQQKLPQQTWIWQPKNRDKCTKQAASKTKPNKPTKPLPVHKHIWIPKDTLHAQGYYNGNKQIWIPKIPKKPITVQPKPNRSETISTIQTAPATNIMKDTETYWRVKADYNKKKYPATRKCATSSFNFDDKLPSTSSNSTVPEKAQLLQQLIYRRVPSELVARRFFELKCLHKLYQS